MFLSLMIILQFGEFLLNHLNSILIGFNTLIGLIIFIRMMIHSRAELKTAPNYKFLQKSSNFISSFAYSLMVACTVTFIFALLSSMIAVNALYYVNNFKREFSNYNQLIATFQFPIFLPTILLIMGSFAIFYSFIEYILLAQPSQDGPMEIQRWIEKTFIDRFHPPWSYIMALIVFFIVVLLAPLITTKISLQFWTGLPYNAKIWLVVLIFLVWIMLGPIFYLSYYSQIGIAQSFYRGRKINLKKDKKSAFFYYIAILGIINTFYSFGKYLILIFDARPDTALNPVAAQGDFWPIIFNFIKEHSNWFTQEQIESIIAFFAIFPLGFTSFIFTTIIFGIVGFYAKFLSKEPLNTPKMVLFAAYIITGIAFSIFINTIVSFPYSFPTKFLNSIGFPLNTRKVEDQILLLRIFAIPLLIEKSINLFFLINFIFVNKSIKQQMEKLILNQAIISEDFSIFQKYMNHNDPQIRLKLFKHLLDYIKLDPKISENAKQQLADIFSSFIFDENPEIHQNFIQNSSILLGYFGFSQQLQLAYRLIAKESPQSIKMGFQVLNQILKSTKLLSNKDLTVFLEILKKISLKSYNKKIFSQLTDFLSNLRRFYPELTQKLVLSFIQSTPRFENLLGLNFIAQFPNFLQYEKRLIVSSLRKFLKQMDVELVQSALHAFVRFVSIDITLIPDLMKEFNQITLNEKSIIQEKIGGVVQFNLLRPEWFMQFFDYLKVYLESHNYRIKADALIACGAMTAPISIYQFFDQIYPYLLQNIQAEEIQVQKAVISSLIVIAQTRSDIYKDSRFHRLFTYLIVDSHSEIRHQVYRFFKDGDPEYLLNDIAVLLKTPLDLEIRVDLLNILSQIIPSIIPYVDDIDLFSILMQQPFETSENRINLSVIQNLQDDKTTLFGFTRFHSAFNLFDSVATLLYDLTYYIPDKYPILIQFSKTHQNLESDLSIAKKLEFYARIVYEELSLERTVGIDFSISQFLNLVHNDFSKIQYHSTSVLIKYLPKLLKIAGDSHHDLFQIGFNLLKFKSQLSPVEKGNLLVFLTETISNNEKYYLSNISLLDFQKQKSISIIPYKDVLNKYMLFCMKDPNPEIQRFLLKSLHLLMIGFSDEGKIREFLIHTIRHSRDPKIKSSAMKFFTSLSIEINNRESISLFSKQLRSSSIEVKAQAIDSLGIILRAFPTISANNKSTEARIVRSLLYRAFYDSYSPSAPIQIRAIIIAHLQTILLIQPNFPVSLKILEQLSREPDESLASQAVSLLFDFIDFNQKKFGEELVILHRFSNSTHFSVQKIMADQIARLWENKIQISTLFPIIFNLTTSNFTEIRQLVFNIIFKIFRQNNSLIALFLQNLFSLTKKDDHEIRRDSLELILNIINNLPVSLEIVEKVNQIVLRMSADQSIEIQILVSQKMINLINQYPQYSTIYLHIISNFLRTNHSEIIKNILPACRVIIQNKAEYKKLLAKHVKKIFKKTQNPFLEPLLRELT